MAIREVKVPPLGDFDEVPVVEVLIGPGDEVRAEEALITLESDKATMDVPAPCDGVVREVSASVGDSVSEGIVLLTIESADAEPEATTEASGREGPKRRRHRNPPPPPPLAPPRTLPLRRPHRQRLRQAHRLRPGRPAPAGRARAPTRTPPPPCAASRAPSEWTCRRSAAPDARGGYSRRT